MSNRNYRININENDKLEALGDSLSSKIRLKILFLLSHKSYSTQELLEELKIVPSTLSFHLSILKKAGLIKYVKSPSKKGDKRNISINVEQLSIVFANEIEDENKTYFESVPIGSFSKASISSPCLIASNDSIINPVDDINIFNSSKRILAQLLSFTKGTIEYNILPVGVNNSLIKEISFSQEICSECPNYDNDWKSHITFWINDIEVGTFLSNGDYGGRKGKYSPDWWSISSSNYGVLVNVSINQEGTFINRVKVSDISIKDLNLANQESIRYKIGVKEDSKYVGGLNIFGRHFGDYKQDIEVTIVY